MRISWLPCYLSHTAPTLLRRSVQYRGGTDELLKGILYFLLLQQRVDLWLDGSFHILLLSQVVDVDGKFVGEFFSGSLDEEGFIRGRHGGVWGLCL